MECGTHLALACTSCGSELPAVAKFCMSCGQAVAGAAEPVPERDSRVYTPKHLADKILNSKSAVEGERKQVTVLFADIQRSLELADGVDPEDWHRIMNCFFAILAEGVHRFEGTINQFTGDGIMALFGAPIAHEDHAQRACYAALHLTNELRRYADELRLERGLNFGVRIGLNSGEVVVGKIGDDLRMDYTAQGHTVGLAARIEQLAESGRAYLTQHTAQLVEGFVQLRDLGPSRVKGVAEPLHVYELEDVGPLRTRLDVSRSRGFSRFVGRQDEMEALERALERAGEGKGQVVGVVADAGVGKSRLCLEFLEQVRARGVQVNEAHCPSHGKTIPFLSMLELLRSYFGISEQDSDATARQKIAGKLILLDRSFDELLPVIFDFLSVPDPQHPAPQMNPEARQRQLFGFVRRLVQGRETDGHGIIAIDDLHWIDSGSDAFLADLVSVVSGTHTLLLLNFRPEYHASWMAKSYYQQLPLVPLGPESVQELLGNILGNDPSVAGLCERIRERTGGNPFFIEEVVQALMESGTLVGARGAYRLEQPLEQLELPASVQSLLAARIDRLAEREKYLLQTASVIGKRFSEPVLKRIAELPDQDLAAALDALQRAELIYQETLYPEAEYVFKHPLTHEVAYGSQLTQRRRGAHAATAQAIMDAYSEKLDEQAALLAHHWDEAGEALEAARWHARAAEWVGTSDVGESVRHWQRVHALLVRLLDNDEADSLRMLACLQLLRFGWRVGVSQEEADALYAEGKAMADQRGDARMVALLAGTHATTVASSGNSRAYVEHATEAARLAEAADDETVRLLGQVGLAYSHLCAGQLAEARAFAERGLELSEANPNMGRDLLGFQALPFFLILRALIRALMGELDQARHDVDRGIELARDADDIENLGWGLGFSVSQAVLSGKPGNAGAHALQAVEIAEKLGSAFSLSAGLYALGSFQILQGNCREAVESLERAIEISHSRGTALESEALTLSSLAQAYLGSGDVERARKTAEEALRIARERGSRHHELNAHIALVRALLASEGAAAATAIEASLATALELVRETGGKTLEPQVLVERAHLARLRGDAAACERDLREAQRLFRNIGAGAYAGQVGAQLESLSGQHA